MSTPAERIKSLMPSLPKRDIPLGYKFLENREFDSLKELIDSAIYKVEKNLKSSAPNEEYLRVNLEELNTLKSEVDIYTMQLEIPRNTILYEDLNSYEIEEEIY